jgi:hypothetical protein
VIVEEMETASGTKAISFTLPCYHDVVPKCFSGKRNVLNVLYSLETSSGQAVENGFNPTLSTGSTTHTVEDARTQIKYQQLTQTGFETGWHVAPWGSTSWLTVENDNAHPLTAEEFFQKDDRAPNTLYLSVNYERCIANPAGLALWKPQAANVETVLLRRGDTIIIPPGAVHKFVNVTDIFCTGGLFMERRHFIFVLGWRESRGFIPTRSCSTTRMSYD